MNGPLVSRTFPLDDRGIALAVTLAILTLIAPHEASANGGTFHLSSAWSSGAEAATLSGGSTAEPTTAPFGLLGGCGGKRYREPNTHRCRGPADIGH